MAGITSLDLLAIHQAVCDTITAPTGARCYPAYRDKPEPPCIMVVGDGSNYLDLNMAFKMGAAQIRVTLLMLATSGGEDGGQEQIMSWLSIGTDDSVVDALKANRSLGGVLPSNPGLVFGAVRYATAVEWPAGSNTRYAVGELDLILTVGA